MALASWPVRKYKSVFFRYSISTKSFRKWPVLKQLKTGTAQDAVGNQGGRGTKYKLISIRKKSQSIGTFLPLKFWVIWAYDYPLSSAECSCTPIWEYTQPLDFKKVLFLPLNSRWYLSPLSLFMRGLLCCYPPFFFVLIVWPGQGTVDWTWQICFWWHNFQLCHFRSRTYSIIVIVTTWTLQVGVVL